MSIETPKVENISQVNPSDFPEKIEEDKEQSDLQENQPSPNFLNSYTSFELNPFEQILINKMIPYGYKLETEENLLKTDEKKKKGYLHRKHKRNNGNTSILENIVDNENNIEGNNVSNNLEKVTKPRRRKKSFSSHDTENKENNKNIIMRKTTREHKPKTIEDLGYIDKDVIKGKSNPLFRAVNKICEKGIMIEILIEILYILFFFL